MTPYGTIPEPCSGFNGNTNKFTEGGICVGELHSILACI